MHASEEGTAVWGLPLGGALPGAGASCRAAAEHVGCIAGFLDLCDAPDGETLR